MRIDLGYSLNNWAIPFALWFRTKSDLPIAGYYRAATLTIGPFDIHLAWKKEPGEARKPDRASEPVRGPVRSAGEADSVRTEQ